MSETKVKAVKVAKAKSPEGSKVYEVGYLIVPSLTPELAAKEAEGVKALVTKAGAEVISEGAPELRALAYTIVKPIGPTRPRYDSAYFGWVKFEMKKDAVADVKKALDGNEKLVRFILIETVRENTLYGAKLFPQKDEIAATSKPAEAEKAAAPVPSTEEEIDKSIDKLVI